jgi:hypothetical protein
MRAEARGPARGWIAELSSRGAHLLVAGGVVALLAGAQLLGFLTAVTVAGGFDPSSMHEPWFAATALASGGGVLASAGTLRARVIVSVLRRRDVLTWSALVVAGFVFWILGVWAAPPGGRAEQFARLGIPLTQAALIGAWAWWARRAAGETVRVVDPRTWGNLLVVLFLALSAVTIALRLPDVYPFSEYTMYSHARVDPYTLSRVAFEATDDDDRTRTVRAPASRQVLLGLVRDGRESTLESMAERVAREQDADRVTVYREVIGVAEYPARPRIEVREREEVVSVER